MNPNANEWEPNNPSQHEYSQGNQFAYYPQQGYTQPNYVQPQGPAAGGQQAQYPYTSHQSQQGYHASQQGMYEQQHRAQQQANMQQYYAAQQQQQQYLQAQQMRRQMEEQERMRRMQAEQHRIQQEQSQGQTRQVRVQQVSIESMAQHSSMERREEEELNNVTHDSAPAKPTFDDESDREEETQPKKKKRKRGRRKKKPKNEENSTNNSTANKTPATKEESVSEQVSAETSEASSPGKAQQQSQESSPKQQEKSENKENSKPSEPKTEPKQEPKTQPKKATSPSVESASASASASAYVPPSVPSAPAANTTKSSKDKSKTAADKKKKSKKKKKHPRHDPREHINLVLIGHVDAGKSTISGQILLQTDQIDERTIAKYEKEAKERNRESWWIAYIMDEDEEEKAKGKTVECGRAHFETDKKRYTILDAPGHKNYVPNMISGASQADVAILVVSARRGEFEAGFERGGQTREHSLLALTLGINRVVVVVNKMDSCEWSKDRYDTIQKEICAFLKEIGYKEKYLEFLPISGQNGTNLKKKVETDTCPWYNGLSMLDTLDSLKKLKRATGKPLRIPVLDRYRGDKGLTIIGKVEAGSVSVGDTVLVTPTKRTATVTNIQIDDVEVEHASAGENVLIAFDSKSQVNIDQVFGGCVVCSTETPCPVVKKFTAQIYLSELPNMSIMTRGYKSMLHIHNIVTECEITDIPHKLHPKNNKRSKKPPQVLRSKDKAIVEITVPTNPIAIETYGGLPQLGRFALRDQGKTIVIGRIENVDDSKDDN